MAPGITKLNIPKATTASPKAAIANNLRATRMSSGTAYGIFAQRSKIGMGVHFNNKLYGSGSISATRHALNDNHIILANNIGNFHKCNHNNGSNTMNKFAVGMMAMNMVAQMGAQIAGTVKDIKAASAANNTNKNDITNAAWEKQFGNDKLQLTNELKNASTFESINTVENKINDEFSNFQDNYSKDITSVTGAISKALDTDVQSTLSSLGITIDSSKIKASPLNINVDDLSTLDTASQTIDKDIETATTFLKSDVTSAISKLETEKGTIANNISKLSNTIAGLDAKIASLLGQYSDINMPSDVQQTVQSLEKQKAEAEKQKAEAEKQQDAVNKALDAMNGPSGVKSLVTDLISTLNNKKASLADIKQVKSNMADKKYQVAEQLQKDITTAQKQMENLEAKIDKAKNNEDKNKLIKEFNGFVNKMNSYKSNLALAGAEPIKNSKGKSISLNQIDAKYLTKKQEISNNASEGGE